MLLIITLLCSYSHGELVSIDELQPFLEPDYRYTTGVTQPLLIILNGMVACKMLVVDSFAE